MSNTDIQALLNGTAAIQTKIEILPQVAGESSIILTESNGVVSWDYEDFRFIKDQGFIGQFIAKQVTGTIKNPSDNFSMTDREFKLQMGIKVGNTLTWYSLGNFLVKKVTDDEVKDTTKFEALDYAKKFNKRYEDTITYPCTMLELVQNICNQCGCELGSTNFKHKNWVIDGNYFQNNESCRDVMKNLGKLAYSWVRVDWDNKVYFDFTKKTTVDSYNKITNHEYYSLTTQKEKKIVNRVVIGYSNIDGEQTKVEDTASIEANGLCEITIFDNPLVYNQALREKAIVGASDLLGLEYTPLEMQTVGHPWLKGYELIEATDMEGKVYKTIPFNRTIQYFGHIKSLIKIETETKTNTEYAYESGLKNDFLNAQIQVNKKLGKITSTVDEMNTTVEDITTTTQTSTGGNSLYLKEALESNALEYSIDGKCEQATRSGKNKFIPLPTGSNSGVAITLNMDGTYNLEGTAVNNSENINYIDIEKSGIKEGLTYILSATKDLPEGVLVRAEIYNGTTWVRQFVPSISSTNKTSTGIANFTNATRIRFLVLINSGITVNIKNIGFQLEEGTIATDYEQYGASPSPDYPSEIKTIKGIRNLFDGVLFNGYLNNGLVADSKWKTTDYIEVKSNTKYITSYLKNTTRVLYEEYTSKDVSSIVSARKETTPKTAITTQNTTKYIRFSFNDNSLTDKEIMLEPGSVAHPYVPYGAWAKVKITGKNLLSYPYPNTTRTTNGITFTDNGDGTITANGTATAHAYFNLSRPTLKPSKYVVSGIPLGASTSTYFIKFGTANYTTNGTFENTEDFTPAESYIRINSGITVNNLVFKPMIEESDKATDYEPYKEKEVLIDLAKENLFDDGIIRQGNNETSSNITRVNYISNNSYPAGTIFTIKNNSSFEFGVGILEKQEQGSNFYNNSGWLIVNEYTFISSNDGYLTINIKKSDESAITSNEVSTSDFKIYKGTNADDSYELNSIGDIKDKLELINGVANIQKKIGKVVLDGSENWHKAEKGYLIRIDNTPFANNNSPFGYCDKFKFQNSYETWTKQYYCGFNAANTFWIRDDFAIATTVEEFKSWLKANPVTVYYELATPETITLPNTNIPLYEGINHVTLVEDLETTTSIKYLRKTPISGEYALNQDLNKTNSNLADTNNQLSQAQSDIDNTKTNLNNNYYNKEQVDSINSTTTQNITQIRNTMEQNITSTNASISKIQEEITNGVSKVTTTTGTFDENGLNISKSGQQMSSTLDWDGLEVVRDKGKATETEVLTVRSAGVEAENMTVRNFFIKKPIRIEKCKSITDSTKVGLGFFWIGE